MIVRPKLRQLNSFKIALKFSKLSEFKTDRQAIFYTIRDTVHTNIAIWFQQTKVRRSFLALLSHKRTVENPKVRAQHLVHVRFICNLNELVEI